MWIRLALGILLVFSSAATATAQTQITTGVIQGTTTAAVRRSAAISARAPATRTLTSHSVGPAARRGDGGQQPWQIPVPGDAARDPEALANGYQLEGNYVLAKDEDNDSNERDPFTDRSVNFFDLEKDWGPSDRDIRHKVNLFATSPSGASRPTDGFRRAPRSRSPRARGA
jgi:hypothetical protein